MTRTRRLSFPAVAFALIFAPSGASAQTSTNGHIVVAEDSRLRSSNLHHLHKLLPLLDTTKLRATVEGTWEHEVILATLSGAASTLRLPIDTAEPSQSFTAATPDGDVLIARWTVASSEGKVKYVWLWDSPAYAVFVLEAATDLLSRDSLPTYCELLFRWAQYPIRLRSIRLTYAQRNSENRPAGLAVLGVADHIETTKSAYHLWLQATASEGRAFLAVGLSKFIFPVYPPEAIAVKERFPALRHRLQTLSKAELVAELGKGLLKEFPLLHPWNRDTIVMRELLSRDTLSSGDLKAILIASYTTGTWQDALAIQERLTAFLLAFGKNNALLTSYAPPLAEVFLDVPISPLASFLGGDIINAMEESGVDFTKASVAFLEREKFVASSLNYLRTHADDAETLNKITRLRVASEHEWFKESTIQSIRRRVLAKEKQ